MLSAAGMRKIFILMLVAVTAGCGLNNPYGEDLYGNAGAGYDAAGGYGDSSSLSTYGDTGLGGGYEDAYGDSSSYTTDYSSTVTAPSAAPPVTSGSYGDYGATYGEDTVLRAAASPRPGASMAPTSALPEQSVLSAWVVDVKEPSLWGRLRGQKVVAKVEIENPGDRTLSGRLRVRFTDGGNPTGVIQTRRVTLAPKEKQVLSFTAQSSRVDDAEALIETEAPAVENVAQVRDR